MTANELAELVVSSHELLRGCIIGAFRKELIDAIHWAIIEHSNAELERKREAQRYAERLLERANAFESRIDELRLAMQEMIHQNAEGVAKLEDALQRIYNLAVPCGTDFGNSDIAAIAAEMLGIGAEQPQPCKNADCPIGCPDECASAEYRRIIERNNCTCEIDPLGRCVIHSAQEPWP